jgi:hypothetical protein
MRIDLLRPTDADPMWRVAIEGYIAMTFSGPDARQRAEHCYAELNARLQPAVNETAAPDGELRADGGHSRTDV